MGKTFTLVRSDFRRSNGETTVCLHNSTSAYTLIVSLCYSAYLLLVLQGDTAEMLASKFRGLVPAMYPFSDEERLCVCNIITTITYLASTAVDEPGKT